MRLAVTILFVIFLFCGEAYAVIGLVTNTGAQIFDADDDTTQLSVTTVAGQLVVVPYCVYASAGGDAYETTIADSQSLTWNKASTGEVPSGHISGYLAWAYNPAFTGSITVTLTHQAVSGNYIAVGGLTFSGIDSAAPQDQSGTNQDINTSVDANVTAAGATDTVDELVVAVACVEKGDSDIVLQTATTGYTNLFNEQDGNLHQPISADYKVISGLQTPTANWSHDDTNTTASDGWRAVLVTFRAAAPPAASAKRRSQTIVIE